MLAKIIDGKKTAEEIKNEITQEVKELSEEGIIPGLAVVLVGNDPASKIYVNNKKRACEQVGIYSQELCLPENTTQAELLEFIESLNNNDNIHGILVQLPLPKSIDEKAVINAIDPHKDVDAFHVENVGKIMIGEFQFLPCTPAGIMALLDRYGVDICGKSCVVLGRSNIVGKPMAMLLLHKNGTVSICHSKTQNLKEFCKTADILIVAVGRPNFVKADMVKEGAVVIDVGINRDAQGKICGDVDFENVKNIASLITPVPGGVGPMTIAMLLKNTVTAAKLLKNTL